MLYNKYLLSASMDFVSYCFLMKFSVTETKCPRNILTPDNWWGGKKTPQGTECISVNNRGVNSISDLFTYFTWSDFILRQHVYLQNTMYMWKGLTFMDKPGNVFIQNKQLSFKIEDIT